MQFDHINVVTEDLDATVSFFADVIALTLGAPGHGCMVRKMVLPSSILS